MTPEPIRILADGTIKQVNPLSGTQVWTVPGRGNRPITMAGLSRAPIDRSKEGRFCAFCSDRYLETPPEKARLIRTHDGWREIVGASPHQLTETTAEFRRVPNLFEIVSLDYWEDNHGYEMPAATRERMKAYLADERGYTHVMAVARTKALASGLTAEQWDTLTEDERLDWADNFFGGGHDVVIARRHYVDGGTSQDHLCGSGSLTVEEHREYTAFTVRAMDDLHSMSDQVRYVATFQNWLQPAGASFDHLHKQLVAIDEVGVQAEREYTKVRKNPNIYNELAVDYAAEHGLLLAENEHAIAYAGFGHRYPTLEVYSKSNARHPWEHSEEEIAGMSDLLHACHAATGPTVPNNEEWYYEPEGLGVPMPWRILVKWRISTLAGFEGGTKINVNTISPFTLHDRVLPHFERLRGEGLLADMRLGAEIDWSPNSLRYVEGA